MSRWATLLTNQKNKVPGLIEFDVGGYVVRMHGEVSEAMLVRALRAAKEAARC